MSIYRSVILHREVLYGHQGHNFHMLYFAADNESYNESKEILYISRKMLTRWWGACKMRISSLSALFFHFLPSVQPDGKAPALQSSSYTHHIWWASCCRVSRRPCVCEMTLVTKENFYLASWFLGGVYGGSSVCAFLSVCGVCVCVCASVYG